MPRMQNSGKYHQKLGVTHLQLGGIITHLKKRLSVWANIFTYQEGYKNEAVQITRAASEKRGLQTHHGFRKNG